MDVNEKVLEVVAEKLYDILRRLKHPSGRTYEALEEALLLLCNEIPYGATANELSQVYDNKLSDKMSDLTLRVWETYQLDIDPNLS